MTTQNISFLDSNRKVVATACVADCGDHFGGTIDMKAMPENLRALFEEFEEIVNGQMFAFLDDVQRKIGSHRITAQFEDGFELPVKDLQVFPSQGELSFQLASVAAAV